VEGGSERDGVAGLRLLHCAAILRSKKGVERRADAGHPRGTTGVEQEIELLASEVGRDPLRQPDRLFDRSVDVQIGLRLEVATGEVVVILARQMATKPHALSVADADLLVDEELGDTKPLIQVILDFLLVARCFGYEETIQLGPMRGVQGEELAPVRGIPC